MLVRLDNGGLVIVVGRRPLMDLLTVAGLMNRCQPTA
jgi:hypothetical protein